MLLLCCPSVLAQETTPFPLREGQGEGSSSTPVRKTRSGMLIIGRGNSVRAVSPFSGGRDRGIAYAEAVNRYYETFGDRMNIYCMVIPTAVAFYCPDEAQQWTQDQPDAVRHIYNHLAEKVIPITLFDTLQAHVQEPIYSRTDHHWAPLGAYYAARAFAAAAEVPFADLSTYDAHVVHDYVGTMYKFSRDIAVRNAPEDFVYYTPRDIYYDCTYIRYTLGRGRKDVIAQTDELVEQPFFYDYPDGSSNAYLCFMHGDDCVCWVRTGTHNGRRLLILKDSFGNALPGYLFHSFEEICVVDCRYFTTNMVDFVTIHHITDILFANNISHAYSPATAEKYHVYLEQK